MPLLRPALVAVAVAAVLAGCGGNAPAARRTTTPSPTSIASPTPTATPTPTPSGTSTPRPQPAKVSKVLVMVVENHSMRQMSAMRFTFGMAQTYGYASNFYAITHPSLPNYIAIAGGSTFGITDDADPSSHPLHAPSVFGRALASGHTAGVYADGMPSPCATTDGGDAYAVRHNPWTYFVDERGSCQRLDVPFAGFPAAVASGRLPDVGMVVPNLCHDGHDCPLAVADAWFKGVMHTVFAGPDWKAGRLAVVLTGDEDDGSAGNKVLTVVIHPSQHGRVVSTRLDHYSLSGLLSQVTGTVPLAEARRAQNLAAAFRLPLSN